MYRLNKENEIANMQKKEQKLETENKRLRAELLVLQKTCNNMRQERDAAVEEKYQALTRAAAFEHDRDKIQRMFKIFRETKEGELQALLRARRELENKLTKIAHGYFSDENDTASRTGLEGPLGNSNPGGDWWTAIESEPSLGSSAHLHTTLRGPEFAHSMMEMEGPFTNVHKEDWSTALANLTQIVPTIPEHALSNTLRLYISAPRDCQAEVDIFTKEYRSKLNGLCENEGRSLLLVHLHLEDDENLSSLALEHQQKARKHQLERSSIFLAFLGDNTNKFSNLEFRLAHLDNPGVKSSVFCFKGNKSSSDARELRNRVRDSGSAKIVDGYTLPSRGAEQAFHEVQKLLHIELGIDAKKEKLEDPGFEVTDGDQIFGSGVWDVNSDFEQMEAMNFSVKSSCELGFEKHYERLNVHVLSAGPLPPLLILGPSGSGRSLLLAKWMQLQIEKSPTCMVLYHFVGDESSVSADPIVMIRRITAQLMQQVSSPPPLTSDPARLVEEFPRWLEKISSKTPGGTILVLDSLDRFQQAEVHLQWLLDPLPVDTRIIVSAHEDTCPQPWRSWPTLQVEPLSNKNVKELVRAEIATLDASISPEDETKVLTHCRNPMTCNPLYVMVLARHVAECNKQDGKVSKHLDALLTSTDTVGLYIKVLELLRVDLESHENRGMVKTILKYLYVSRCGLSEAELMDLIPNLHWNFQAPFSTILVDHLVLKYQSGLLMFAHQQVKTAVCDFCFGKEEPKTIVHLRQELIQYFSQLLSPSKVSCRVADELPWLFKQIGDKEGLKNCILNMFVFQKMYARGRCDELFSYWQFIGAEKNSMTQAYFTAIKKMQDSIAQYNGTVTLPRIADMYETLGRFLKDLGHLNQAASALQTALEIRETALDPDHPVVAHSLHQLAGLHAQWGKFSTAEALYKQALDIYENALGGEHLMVAKELEALAILYQKQDKHDLAEPIKKRAMHVRKTTKTPRTPPARTPRGVDPLQRRALQLEELCIGPESPALARTLNELGVLYYLQNNFETAESLLKRSLEMREALLGPDHPDIAQSLNNLAALYNDRKQPEKAEPLYERALHIRLQSHNPDHPSVASIIKHLALLYRRQSKFDKAEPMYKQAVEIREKTFGTHHPSVATALVNLAVLYSQQNKYAEAEPLYEKALKIYEDSLGPSHPRVAETLRNLAVMKYELKDFETAAKLYKRATEIKDSDAAYPGKGMSRRSSSGDTNSTIKNLLQT
ncbi:hypothetical protein CHS0354_012470 [Potamilus streckersoni]|uniref:Nephrocystin-3 n=1 Tax=Potamilus streckersoni TaxID=2493646 RepID=A0AAE0S0E2_9BIVA|nr:hypothetical protein CHS0354_012470 [Potamilus streckersoni]